ncbi:MAG: hypothetical protein ACRDK8_12945, partial [Solirubrobacteraceae bacterium]
AMLAGYAGLDAGTCFDVAWTAAALAGTIGAAAARRAARARRTGPAGRCGRWRRAPGWSGN